MDLLEYIRDAGELLPGFLETPHMHALRLKRATYYGSLRQLERKEFIKKVSADKQIKFVITEKGKKILRLPVKKERRTDGHSTIVIFDIPSEKNRERTIFRRFLIRNGYTLIQKSVLIAPLKISLEAKDLIDELKIKSFVTVISGKINQVY